MIISFISKKEQESLDRLREINKFCIENSKTVKPIPPVIYAVGKVMAKKLNKIFPGTCDENEFALDFVEKVQKELNI